MFRIKSSLINLCFVLFLVLLISSCGKISTTSTSVSDQASIENLISQNSNIFGTDYLLGDESADTSSPQSITTQSAPDDGFRWYRVPNRDEVTQEITITMDSSLQTAQATVKIIVPGTLYVFEKSGIGIGEDSFTKSFQDEFLRKGKFTKNSAGSWDLSEITPVTIISTSEANTQTVSIKKVTVSKKVGDTFEKVLEVTDPTQYIPISNFPVFTQADEVKVEFDVDNSNSSYSPASYGYLHTVNKQGIPWRFVLYNDGLTKEDSVADDSIHTNTWSLEGIPSGMHRAIFDVLGADTFNKSDANYNSTSWGFVYTIN